MLSFGQRLQSGLEYPTLENWIHLKNEQFTIRKPNKMASLGRFIYKKIFYVKLSRLTTIRNANKMAAILIGFWMVVSLDRFINKYFFFACKMV